MYPAFLFLILDLEKIFFYAFCAMQKKHSYFIWLVWANASCFCAVVMFLGMYKVLKDLDKIY